MEKPEFKTLEAAARVVAPAQTREIYLDLGGKSHLAKVLSRSSLASGEHVVGPAIIEQPDTTILVLPGQCATLDAHDFMIVRPV